MLATIAPKIFITSPHNKPSGGTKVLNQVSNLFREKGFESYVVVPDYEYLVKAEWTGDPAPVISLKDMIKMCDKEDIIIDGWQKTEIYKATMSCPAEIKVFWSHGASIPIGRGYVGEKIFKADSGYTHHWNVSMACRNYIEETYDLKDIAIVHPFFDDDPMKKFLDKKTRYKRKGILCLARRGSSYISYIVSKFGSENEITVIRRSFHISKLYNSLLKHRFFISLDNGVTAHSIRYRISLYRKFLLGKNKIIPNSWLVPRGSILGFPMSAAESAWLGAVVIGFPMGGGLEWMRPDNCFMAEDRDLNSLIHAIDSAINSDDVTLDQKVENAFNAVKRFNKDNTWKQIADSLDLKC